MTIFDYLKDIVVKKSGTMTLDNYVPYMINRWLSFINPSVCEMISQFDNKTLLEDKEMHYKTVISMFPKMKYCPKISYIKKVKEDKAKETDYKIEAIAYNLEISKREASFLLSSF